MILRPMKTSDISALEAIAAGNGYEYPEELNHPHIEAVLVVEDDQGRIIAAAAAKRITEQYFWASNVHSPIAKVNALQMLHDGMSEELRKLGYSETNCFLPPQVEKTFGNRLRKMFGWRPNWFSLYRKF